MTCVGVNACLFLVPYKEWLVYLWSAPYKHCRNKWSHISSTNSQWRIGIETQGLSIEWFYNFWVKMDPHPHCSTGVLWVGQRLSKCRLLIVNLVSRCLTDPSIRLLLLASAKPHLNFLRFRKWLSEVKRLIVSELGNLEVHTPKQNKKASSKTYVPVFNIYQCINI